MQKQCKIQRVATSPAREVAYPAVMCALLIGGQYVFSFVAGVEIVTVLLLSFCYVFGARRGAICAIAFSILRCLLFGFYPTVIVLYLIYYPLFALFYGVLGRLKSQAFASKTMAAAVNILLFALAIAAVILYATDAIKVAKSYKLTVNILLWVIAAACAAMALVYDGALIYGRTKNTAALARVIAVAATAAVWTAAFTLLDDVITPLFLGYTRLTALAYFYSSFTAMLPQTVCAVITVCTLFTPICNVLERVKGY